VRPNRSSVDGGITAGLCELTLETADPFSLAGFYERVFGWQRLSEEPDRIWLACGEDARIGFWAPGEKEFGDRGGRHVHYALSIPPGRMTALCDHLEREGIDYRGPVEHDGGDRSIYFSDPERNLVEAWDFFERRQDAEALAE
jgi:catechol-2,3-dioxygenase